VLLSVIFSLRQRRSAILIVARRKPATNATQAAGGDKTVLKLRSVTERKQSKMGGDDETDV
jgi:hypothetical protein